MKKKRNAALDYLVYVAVRLAVGVLQALPIDAAVGLARALALLAYGLDRRHRGVALENLRHAFGDQYTERERRRLVRGVYEHFLIMLVEIARIPRTLHIANWKRFIRVRGAEPVVRAVLERRPVLLVTGHFGNWEMAGYLVAAIGIRSFAIARKLDNPYLDKYLLQFRQWSGQTILDKNTDFARIEQVLADRQPLISLGDQSAGPRGYFVPFFHRLASTHRAIALLARAHGAIILVGTARRTGPPMHYTINLSAPIDPADYEHLPDAPQAITAAFTRALEAAIREAPEQYLWLHHRWKHAPPLKRRGGANVDSSPDRKVVGLPNVEATARAA